MVVKEYQGPDPFSSASFQSLEKLIAERLRGKVPGGQEVEDFENVERELHEGVMACEAELVAACVSRYDESAPEVEVNEVVHRRKGEFPKEYCGLAGKFQLTRALYVPRDGEGKAVCPLELRAGMVEGYWTPRAARVMARAVTTGVG